MNTVQKIHYTSIIVRLLKDGEVVRVSYPKNLRKFPKDVANKIKDGGIQCYIYVKYSNGSDNEIFCKTIEDFEYAKNGFVEEYK